MTADEAPQSHTTALLSDALARRSPAERRLWEVLHPMLLARARRRLARSPLRKSMDPDDVAAEVWIRIYASQALRGFDYRGKGSLAAFVGSILDKTVKDCERRLGALRRGSGVEPAGLESLAGELGVAHSPSSDARAGELVETCRRLLDLREWEVFRMKELEGMTSAAIGERLGLTDASVRGIAKRSRDRLRDALGLDE